MSTDTLNHDLSGMVSVICIPHYGLSSLDLCVGFSSLQGSSGKEMKFCYSSAASSTSSIVTLNHMWPYPWHAVLRECVAGEHVGVIAHLHAVIVHLLHSTAFHSFLV